MRRFLISLGLALVAVLAFGVSPHEAKAAEVRTGDEVTIGTSERIEGDLYIFADTIRVNGVVTGDLIAAGRVIRVTGQVGGANLAAEDVEVSGQVDRSLRVAGADIDVEGTVGGDVLAASGKLRLFPNATVGEDMLIGGGEVTVDGAVGGDIRGSADELTVSNTVGGRLDVEVETLTLTGTARVAGDVRYSADEDAEVAQGAQVGGETVRRAQNEEGLGSGDYRVGLWELGRLLAGLITGLLLVLFIPRAMARVADQARINVIWTALVGLLWLVLAPVAMVILLVTVLGIPFALVLLGMYLIVLYLSQVFVGMAIGRAILPKGWDRDGRGYNLLAMAIGVTLLGVLRGIPAPVVGLVVGAITAVIGLGAFVRAIRIKPLPV